MHKEDPFNPGSNKRYKRAIPDGLNDDDGSVMINPNDPFFYTEEVQFYRESSANAKAVRGPSKSDIEVDILADINDIYPLGYPTE